jgi:ABC-type lipoprotein export system ATPase subunit
MGVAIATSVLLDVAMPFIVATIFEKHASDAEFREFLKPLAALAACVVGGCMLDPLRKRLRRLVHDRGYTGLQTKIKQIVTESPSVGSKLNRSAKKEFLDTWSNFVIILFDQFIPFVVGVGGLMAILFFKASFTVVPVIVVLLGTVWLARKVGDIMGSTWSDYKDQEHIEVSMLNDLVASAQMLWLVEIISRMLEKADATRSKAMHVYIKAMVRYQAMMTALGNGFKFVAISSGVVMGVVFDAPFSVTTLLLVYGLILGDRMATIFSMNDMLTSSAVDAEALVRALEEAKPLGPELRATVSVIQCKGLRVEYRSERAEVEAKAKDAVPPAPVVVSFPPELRFGPGVTLIMGASGCGKTSLLSALNGLPYSGSITLGGIELAGRDPRKRIVYGQQSFEPLEEAVALDLFGGEAADLEVVQHALWCAGYAEAPLKRLVSEYSGGQWKRLMLAAEFYPTLQRDRSMAGVLGLDEPTNHLDSGTAEKPGSVERLLRGIRQIADDDPGLAILIVTHDDQLKEIADDIVYL